MYRKLSLGACLAAVVLSVPSLVPTALAGASSASLPAQAAPTVKATENGANYVFEPASITIQVGQSVTFQNAGAIPHTATADDGSWDSANALDPTGGKFTTPPFAAAGSFSYKCTYHAALNMVGTIVVQGAGGTAAPAGGASPPAAAGGAAPTATAGAPTPGSTAGAVPGASPGATAAPFGGVSPGASPAASPGASGGAAPVAAGLPTPPSQKYFPKIAGILMVLALVSIGLGYMKMKKKMADRG